MDAIAGSGAKPNIAILDVATPVALNFKKFLRDTRIDMGVTPGTTFTDQPFGPKIFAIVPQKVPLPYERLQRVNI
jgi:hypothetical protein